MNRIALTIFLFMVFTTMFHVLRIDNEPRVHPRAMNQTFLSVPHGVYVLHLPKGGRRCSDECILRSYQMDP